MYSMFSSSIAAISTPKGSGGIAVIRISGKDSIAIADRFVRLYGKKQYPKWRRILRFPAA